MPGRASQPTPTLIAPGSGTWFDRCCASDMRSFQRALDATERDRQRVATIYNDTGHTQGKALIEQFGAQLDEIRTIVQAVASAATPQEGHARLEAVSPVLNALANTLNAARFCCSAASSVTPAR